MAMIQTVSLALKDKNLALYKELAASGQLNEYVTNLADEIQSEIVSLTQEQRIKGKWDRLGPMECASKMKVAHSLNRELVLAQMLEFPQDTTDEEAAAEEFMQTHGYPLEEYQALPKHEKYLNRQGGTFRQKRG